VRLGLRVLAVWVWGCAVSSVAALGAGFGVWSARTG